MQSCLITFDADKALAKRKLNMIVAKLVAQLQYLTYANLLSRFEISLKWFCKNYTLI